MTLKEFFNKNKRAVLGFSGGVDSVYLLYAAKSYGARVYPCFVKTPFQPSFELADAKRAAHQIGTPMKIIEHDILTDNGVADNPPNRCYYCKKTILKLLLREAHDLGIPLVIDGTNASDSFSDRPGMAALSELGIRSPLRECSMTKEEIRAFSKSAGLFTYDKPSYSCLATRIPTDEKITFELLEKVEKSENELLKMNFTDFRVRVFHGAARLQFKECEQNGAFSKRDAIAEKLQPYFDTILFDLKGR